jgi:hypothetical protein
VRVKDKALAVRHRDGYRALTDNERLAARTRAALLLGGETNPYGIALEFGTETTDKDGDRLVPVTVKFPLSKLVLLPRDRHQEGKVRIFVGTRDDRGRVSHITQINIPVRIPNERLATALPQVAACKVDVKLRKGPNRLAIAVWDELAKTDSTVTASYTAGKDVAR